MHRFLKRLKEMLVQLKKKWLGGFAALFAMFVAILLPFHWARAGWFILDDIAATAIGFVVFVINYLLAILWGITLALEAWFIQVILDINRSVVNHVVVQKGFAVTLSIVNLGFVAAIIVIAIATIVRFQTYGIKQLLWKLIVAAVLVNFSLVIAGAILGTANSFSDYFLSAFPGQGQDSNLFQFANRITTAFQPQKFITPDAKGKEGEFKDSFDKLLGATGSGIGNAIAPIFSLVFANVALFLMVITLAALVIMLLIRYVILGILLILMPFAWLFWIFPALKSHWSRWWSEFIRWTFFAPIVLFFLYLVILAGDVMVKDPQGASVLNPFNGVSTNFDSSSSNPVLASLSLFFGDIFTPILTAGLTAFILIGLTVGGLFAANKMSIIGAKASLDAVKGAVKGAGKYTWRKQTGGAARSLGGKPKPPSERPKGWRGTLAAPLNWARKQVEKNQALQAKLRRYGAKTAKETGVGVVSSYKYNEKTGEKTMVGKARFPIVTGFMGAMVSGAAQGTGLYKKKRKVTKGQAAAIGLTAGQARALGIEIVEEKPASAGATPTPTQQPTTPQQPPTTTT